MVRQFVCNLSITLSCKVMQLHTLLCGRLRILSRMLEKWFGCFPQSEVFPLCELFLQLLSESKRLVWIYSILTMKVLNTLVRTLTVPYWRQWSVWYIVIVKSVPLKVERVQVTLCCGCWFQWESERIIDLLLSCQLPCLFKCVQVHLNGCGSVCTSLISAAPLPAGLWFLSIQWNAYPG